MVPVGGAIIAGSKALVDDISKAYPGWLLYIYGLRSGKENGPVGCR
jgi:hypothetical protein